MPTVKVCVFSSFLPLPSFLAFFTGLDLFATALLSPLTAFDRLDPLLKQVLLPAERMHRQRLLLLHLLALRQLLGLGHLLSPRVRFGP